MRNYFYWLIVAFGVNAAAWCADRDIVPASAFKSNFADGAVEVREFEVRVDNRVVGTHRLAIKSDGESHKAEFQTDVKVDVIVYAYVYKCRGNESWRGGRVEDTEIRCEDGGKKRSFALKTEGSRHQVSFNGKPVPRAPRAAMTTAYWKLPPAELREMAFSIVDVDTGVTQEATLSLVGPDTVTAGGRSISCRHFKIDGPSPAELWFDDQDRLVRQRSVESGHQTELKLKQIRISKDEN